MKIDSIRIVPHFERYLVVITTKTGRIYHGDWADEPTEEDVRTAWNQDRKWFIHIN